MNDLPERLARLCWIAVGLLLASVLLSACGPGSGGTGTGPVASAQFFSSPMAAAGAAGPAQACDCGRVDVQLSPQGVQLTTRCGSFVQEGGWAADASGRAELGGQFQAAAGASMAATLELQFHGDPADSTHVVVTVRDAAGAVLVGPTTVDRQAGLAPREDGNCP